MHLSPYQLARENRTLTLDVPLDALPRFASLVAAEGEAVRVEVQFDRDEQGRCHMHGRLRTRQRFLCANCREVEACDMDVEVDACLLSSDDAARELLGEVDPLVIEGPEATPAQLFEDDLLLALPERPCYGSEACPHRVQMPEDELPEQQRDNPFAVLAELKDGSRRRDD
ncbi:MAG: hypothetical protein EA417_13115 [Gammaproteobacteria bacterium]|nr:MAG: hypothetical protein EA417_13115 [Gammaproteobacteria bacterium]